jgi:amino acid permease
MLAIVLNQALHVVVQYWAPDLSPAVMITTGLVGLILANGFSSRVYGEIGEH